MSARPRRIVTLVTAVLMLLPVAAFASRDMIGLYSDEMASNCAVDLPVYSQVDVYVIATLSSIDGLISAEFKLDNYPSGGIITPFWNSPLTIGYLDDDFAIAFGDPQTGSTVILGRLEFMSINQGWPGSDYVVKVAGGSLAPLDEPIIVDSDGETIGVSGGRFTFNCTNDTYCTCGDGSTADQNISALKHHY